jgi:hypothetical protein
MSSSSARTRGPSTSANYNEFLYLYVKEVDGSTGKVDNQFRVVFWPSDDAETAEGTFVVYGQRDSRRNRPPSTPYRLELASVDAVVEFIDFTVASDATFAVELHTFRGWYDDRLDPYFIDWEQCPLSPKTEMVAYDGNFQHSQHTIVQGLQLMQQATLV